MICTSCSKDRFIPLGEVCLPCTMRKKRRQDVEKFKKNAAPKEAGEIPLISIDDF